MKELAKIFVFTKDEKELMKYWIPYHGQLVGFHNLYICDNGSTDGVGRIYKKYRSRGIHVKDCSEVRFMDKRRELSQLMREYRETCHFVIPLDSDEFIVKKTDQSFTCDPDTVRDYLKNLDIVSTRYKFQNLVALCDKFKYSNPLLEMTKFVDNSTTRGKKKSYFPALHFRSTDQGNHSGTVMSDKKGKKKAISIITDLALLHFEIRGFDHFVTKTMKGATAYGFGTPERKKNKVGRHWFKRWRLIKAGRGEKLYKRRIALQLDKEHIVEDIFAKYIKHF